MSDFNLATADKHQMKFYAANELTPPLKLTLNMSEKTMREEIQDHCTKNDLAAPAAVVTGAKPLKAADHYVTINIAASEKPGGNDPVFVGVQGVGYTIPRAIDVDVPNSVVGVLKNAMQDLVTQDDDGDLQHKDVLAYPFSILADPSPNQPGELAA